MATSKKKTIEMVGPAGRIVVPEKEKENYKSRGYSVVKSTFSSSKQKVIKD